MKWNRIFLAAIVMLGVSFLCSSLAFSAGYTLSETAPSWVGTAASRLIATTTDYNYTYGDESSVTFNLPWPFTFYGQSYTQINADTNGNIWFTAAGSANSFDLVNTGRGPVIAAWNNDLSSNFYGGVFIQRVGSDQVVVEWQTESYTDEGEQRSNKFEVVLSHSGDIRFDYATFDTSNGMDFGSGISNGTGTALSLTSPEAFVSTLAGRSFLFSDNLPTFSITVTPSGSGTVSPAGPITVNQGSIQTFSFQPSTGSYLAGVQVDGVPVVVASTEPPSTGYHFVNWTGTGGFVTTTSNPLTVTNVTAAQNITANFAINQYAITFDQSGCGTVMPAGPLTVNHGGDITITFQPDAGSYLKDVKVGGVSIGVVPTFSTYIHTFSNITADVTISTIFQRPDGDADNNGSVTIADALTALRVSVELITPTPQILAAADVSPLDATGHPAPDGKVNISDALLILRKVVGLVSWNQACGSSQQSLAMSMTTTNTLSVITDSNPSSTPLVTVVPSGNGTYTIQGTNMDGVAAILVKIAYDTTTLGSPSVTQGSLVSGATMIANTTTSPGFVTIGIISSTVFAGSGPIAVVNFATWNGASNTPTLQKYDLTDSNGQVVSTFDVNILAINVASTGCGTVTPAGPVTVTNGSSQTFYFQASTGSYLADVKIDGVSVGIVPSYTFTNITAGHTLLVSFIIPDGDVNNDGVVNSADYNLAIRIAVNLDPLTPMARAHGDVAPLVNGTPAPNGVIDIADAFQILNKANGQITWNTACVAGQQGMSALQLDSLATTSSLPDSAEPIVQNTSACANYYKKFDESTLTGILDMLVITEKKGKAVVINNGHSIVMKKIDGCEIDLQIYDDIKHTQLLCTEKVISCK